MKPRRTAHVFALVLLVAACTKTPAGGGGPSGNPNPLAGQTYDLPPTFSPKWKEVLEAVADQKQQAALDIALVLTKAAREAGREEEWAHGLIEATRLRISLHGYETAVRTLKEEPWPKGEVAHTALQLYYAQALLFYNNAYRYEIAKREKVSSKNPVDLKAWTREEIYIHAARAIDDLFQRRDALGKRPLKVLARYINPSGYPENVRGTLRDFVAYLFVQLLADTNGWRPGDSNDLFRLDLGALLGSKNTKVDLTDPDVHPLVRIAALCEDLESWHMSRGQREAALEARLERVRRLLASFKKTADRERIYSDLEKRLPAFRDVPWWSAGMAVLADAIEKDGDAVRARKIASAGAAAYPNSHGASGCTAIVRKIDAWDYRLAVMSADAPGKRSIEVEHRNLSTLYFRAYAYDLVQRVESARDYNLLPAYREAEAALAKEKPIASWKVDLPATPDFRMHRTYVTPPLTKSGLYLLVASTREDFADKENRVEALNFVVTDLVLLIRRHVQRHPMLETTVVSGATGAPVSGAEVRLYEYNWSNGHRLAQTKPSGPDGLVEFKDLPTRQSYFVLVRHSEQVAIDPSYQGLYWSPPPPPTSATLIYTDRSIYRPLQRILWKAVAYTGDRQEGSYTTSPSTSVSVRLVDPNNQTVDTRTVTTNEYGTASGEFTIPTGRLLGNWRLETSPRGSASVRVEEYKRPTFEAKIEDPSAPLRLNQKVTLTGLARYYFGLPVAAGKVRWQVTREPIYPYWRWSYWWSPPIVTTQTIAGGAVTLGPDGKFPMTFTPEADERDAKDGVSYRYALSADVTDEGGETRSASRAFRLGFVAVQASIISERGYVPAGAPSLLEVRRTNLDGLPRAGAGRWRLLAVQPPPGARLPADEPLQMPKSAEPKVQTPGDALRSRADHRYSPEAVMRTWADGAELGHGEVRHDTDGKGLVSVMALQPGIYRLRYETKDEFGARFDTALELVVAGAAGEVPAKLPLLVRGENTTLRVGETARLIVNSGLEGQKVIVERFRAGKRLSREVRPAGQPALFEFPVTDDDRGGFSVTVNSVRDHQLMAYNLTYQVPWEDKELDVSFSTFRDKIRPGAKETWRVTVAPKGRGSERALTRGAELLAYMYDRSLDLFTPHRPPVPLSLYPSRNAGMPLTVTLGRNNAVWTRGGNHAPGYYPMNPDTLRFYAGYAIGGMGGRRYYSRGAAPATVAAPAPAQDMLAKAEEKVSDKDARDSSGKEREGKDGQKPPAPTQEVRSNFAETAFWQPHLLLGPEGSAVIEFVVPDSVTSWNVWVHAVTNDLRSGSVKRETRSVKELMVRPYLPRFLREGDAAEIAVVVNNASEGPLEGSLKFEIRDPVADRVVSKEFGLDSGERSFQAPKGGSAKLRFPVKVPARVGSYEIRVTASTGKFSDGELRGVPVLPSRMHLMQSRFTTLKNADKKTLTFADLAKEDDPSRINEQLVVTIDAQLFYQVLAALPYLSRYPYECTEQTLNRFVSTGIVSKLFDKYPAVKSMAEKMSARTTPLETFDAVDPNRKMALEETPWLEMAKGGRPSPFGDINVLDPRVARAEREEAIGKLRQAQTSNGAFPWFPGGPPSPYMTLYLLHGFAKAVEFGVDVPKDMVQRAWQYLGSHVRAEYLEKMRKKDCCWEFLTFLNYVASAFPDESWRTGSLTDAERKEILEFSFKHWKKHSPYLKGYLSLTLKRAGREADGRKVFASVMDSSKTNKEQGTFWAAEERSWLWYNDTIESHAFALRTLMELVPGDNRRHGLVQWLLLNKKMNQWKSTRATAEVIYSLIHYLKAEGALGVREDAKVTVGAKKAEFVFEPDQYTGKKNQIVIPGLELDPKTQSTVVVEKTTPGTMFASATWHFSTEKLPTEERGDFFWVSRKMFKRERQGKDIVLLPLADGAQVRVGDELEIQVSMKSKHSAEYVHLRAPRAAGLEPENAVSKYRWEHGIVWYEETRDSGNNFFFERLPQGEYTFKYRLRASLPGKYRIGPATVQSMYAPEFAAYSTGEVLTIVE